jgi:predicted SnoaL-like aldol condensation-catalyzing enzyme
MSERENKRLVRRLFEEALGAGNLAVVDELVAPSFVSHSSDNATREGFKHGITVLQRMSPDLHYSIEDVFAKGAKVAIRVSATGTVHVSLPQSALRNKPPSEQSGQAFTTHEIHIFRLRKGKIVEHWLGTWKPRELAKA